MNLYKRDYKMVKISDLIPYVNNARTHSPEQVAQIAASIQEFGFTNPILIDEKNSVIAGHGRLAAAAKLDLDEVPAIVIDGLTEAQKKALILADNKLALNAGWDDELLALELQSLGELDYDLSLIGFSDEELDEYLDNMLDDEYPDLPDGDREPFQQMTFTFHDDQAELVKEAIKKAKEQGEGFEGYENENSNGNAIYFICERFLNGKS
jgi:ParB-like chromosome segregation protein Spo0J